MTTVYVVLYYDRFGDRRIAGACSSHNLSMKLRDAFDSSQIIDLVLDDLPDPMREGKQFWIVRYDHFLRSDKPSNVEMSDPFKYKSGFNTLMDDDSVEIGLWANSEKEAARLADIERARHRVDMGW